MLTEGSVRIVAVTGAILVIATVLRICVVTEFCLRIYILFAIVID
jgi:hypothetical protein